ncbi:MAG TPA: hypothetical protein VN258_18965 [Mobilitalea sp.]|nr:hypothetical protein [Mobilitalea sp.]
MGPIDIMRSQEASQIKHMEIQRTQHLQEQASKSFQSMVENEHNKPKELTKSDNPEYRYDAKEKGNNQYTGSNNKRKEKKEEEKKDNKDAKSPRKGFDMLI